jgi:hypothetical protein
VGAEVSFGAGSPQRVKIHWATKKAAFTLGKCGLLEAFKLLLPSTMFLRKLAFLRKLHVQAGSGFLAVVGCKRPQIPS